MATNSDLMRAADNIRILATSMVEKAKSGHPGGAMGGADFVNILFAEFLEHLRKQHWVLLALWPLLLGAWVRFFGTLEYLTWPEYTGLHEAFVWLTQTEKADKLLVDLAKTGYPRAALWEMFSFYIPKGYKLELIELTPKNVSLSWQTNPKTYILLPLCSHVHLLETSVKTFSEEDGAPLLFRGDTCLYTAHPIAK